MNRGLRIQERGAVELRNCILLIADFSMSSCHLLVPRALIVLGSPPTLPASGHFPATGYDDQRDGTEAEEHPCRGLGNRPYGEQSCLHVQRGALHKGTRVGRVPVPGPA